MAMTSAEIARFATALAALCERARRELPGFELRDDVLIEALARHATPATIDTMIANCRAAELALAAAAADGSEQAIGELERRFAPIIDETCRRYARGGHGVDDLRQILRTKLFVERTIAEYNGQGSFDAWLRVIATRCFIDLGRRKDRAREALPGDELDDAILARDLVLDAIKAQYRGVVIAALRAASAELPPGDRHLLRQHFVAGLSIDQIGAVLGIHRATAARRLAKAREQLVVRVREHLTNTIDERELAEIFDLVISNIEVSMLVILATPPQSP